MPYSKFRDSSIHWVVHGDVEEIDEGKKKVPEYEK